MPYQTINSSDLTKLWNGGGQRLNFAFLSGCAQSFNRFHGFKAAKQGDDYAPKSHLLRCGDTVSLYYPLGEWVTNAGPKDALQKVMQPCGVLTFTKSQAPTQQLTPSPSSGWQNKTSKPMSSAKNGILSPVTDTGNADSTETEMIAASLAQATLFQPNPSLWHWEVKQSSKITKVDFEKEKLFFPKDHSRPWCPQLLLGTLCSGVQQKCLSAGLPSDHISSLHKILAAEQRLQDTSDCRHLSPFPPFSLEMKTMSYIDTSVLVVLLTCFLFAGCCNTIKHWGWPRTGWLICFKAEPFILETS